jgi:hypothetical protein
MKSCVAFGTVYLKIKLLTEFASYIKFYIISQYYIERYLSYRLRAISSLKLGFLCFFNKHNCFYLKVNRGDIFTWKRRSVSQNIVFYLPMRNRRLREILWQAQTIFFLRFVHHFSVAEEYVLRNTACFLFENGASTWARVIWDVEKMRLCHLTNQFAPIPRFFAHFIRFPAPPPSHFLRVLPKAETSGGFLSIQPRRLRSTRFQWLMTRALLYTRCSQVKWLV